MPNHALAILTGHLGKDPELKASATGTDILRFSLAINTGFGERKKTTWWAVTMFGKRATAVSSYLSKGKPVTVVGEPSVREYTTSDGRKGWSAEIIASDIVLLGGRDDREQAPAAEAEEAPAASEDDTLVPF